MVGGVQVVARQGEGVCAGSRRGDEAYAGKAAGAGGFVGSGRGDGPYAGREVGEGG